MKYGLLSYEENTRCFNIGDYIQSLAAKQFLPQIDCYVNREKLADYDGNTVKMIMNGWFTHNIHNWIPNENIDPLFVSFHLNSSAAPIMLNETSITYLKKHEPIGCRDRYTVKLLTARGIKSYFTGCLTLTLDSYTNPNVQRDNIYIVDPLYNYPSRKKISTTYKTLLRAIQCGDIWRINKKASHLKNFISEEILREAIYLTHELPVKTHTDEEKFIIAENLLHKYAKARLVITSRIHCALPCLAFNTPVIYINGFESFVDTCRFDGILELFNRIDINPKNGKFATNFNLEGKITEKIQVENFENHKELSRILKEKCNLFIKDM
jgi:hypothetical protein